MYDTRVKRSEIPILKTFVIRSFFFKKWLLTHVFGGSQGHKSSCKQACTGFMTFYYCHHHVFKLQRSGRRSLALAIILCLPAFPVYLPEFLMLPLRELLPHGKQLPGFCHPLLRSFPVVSVIFAEPVLFLPEDRRVSNRSSVWVPPSASGQHSLLRRSKLQERFVYLITAGDDAFQPYRS